MFGVVRGRVKGRVQVGVAVEGVMGCVAVEDAG